MLEISITDRNIYYNIEHSNFFFYYLESWINQHCLQFLQEEFSCIRHFDFHNIITIKRFTSSTLICMINIIHNGNQPAFFAYRNLYLSLPKNKRSLRVKGHPCEISASRSPLYHFTEAFPQERHSVPKVVTVPLQIISSSLLKGRHLSSGSRLYLKENICFPTAI